MNSAESRERPTWDTPMHNLRFTVTFELAYASRRIGEAAVGHYLGTLGLIDPQIDVEDLGELP